MLLPAARVEARVFKTQGQALASAFPREVVRERQSIFLREEEVATASELSGDDIDSSLVVRYLATENDEVVGYVYFDAHRVRTLPETLMIVVLPDGSVDRVEILAFREPLDYLPRDRWLEQFEGEQLDDDLTVKRGIRPISGATLTGHAITRAVRRVLALHHVIEERSDEKKETEGE